MSGNQLDDKCQAGHPAAQPLHLQPGNKTGNPTNLLSSRLSGSQPYRSLNRTTGTRCLQKKAPPK
jgi:hypothetical protein